MNDKPDLDATLQDIRVAWRHLCRNLRWLLIEWLLTCVVSLIRVDDPNALPLLEALSKRYNNCHTRL